MLVASYQKRVVRLTIASGLLLSTAMSWAQSAPDADSAQRYPECTTKPTEGDTAAAKGAFQAGTAAYNEADYARSITYWEDAFRRDCTATALLLNLARAYESNSQFGHAVVALETYNARSPDSPQRDQIERRIERLKDQQSAQASQTAPALPSPSPSSSAETPTEKKPPPPPTQERESPSAVPLIIAIAGGGIALLGTAGYIKASSDLKKYEEQCPNRDCGTNDTAKENANKARDQKIGAGALAIGGAVIGIGGGVWYFLEVKRANRVNEANGVSRLRVLPEVAPGYAGASFSGQFSF